MVNLSFRSRDDKVNRNQIFNLQHKNNIIISIIIGFSAAMLYHLVKQQRNFFSWRYLAYSILIALGVSLLCVLFNQRVLARFFFAFNRSLRIFAILTAVLLSLALLVQTHFEPAYFLLPEAQLEILIRIDDLPPDAEGVRLLGLRTRWDYEPFTRLQIDGQYRKEGVNLLFSDNQDVRIRWQGRVGPWAEITFRQTTFDQPVEVIWQGVRTVTNLALGDQETILIRQDFRLAWYHFLPYVLAFTITVAYALTALMLLLSGWKYSDEKKKQPAKHAWLLFMLPMLAAWLFTLLVFWPGSMTLDSLAQWRHALTGHFNNWHPAFHSLIIAFLMRIWYTPAIVALVQMVLLALVAAWGLGTLQYYGVPKLVLWGISFLSAFSPINNLQVITLWKDIPYAIAVLWMTILLLRIVLSRGAANQRPRDWIILGLTGFSVSIFRKNGYPAAIITLLMLPFVYKTYWKQFIGSFLITVLIYAVVNGPLYALMGVSKVSTGQSNLVLLHHISAHVANETPLEEDERAYLNSILPLKQWDYSCCTVSTVSYDKELERSRFLMNTQENMRIATSLFLRNPMVDIRHMTCASELVWRFANNTCYIKSTHGFNSWEMDQQKWIRSNEMGLVANSQLPELLVPYREWLRNFGFLDETTIEYLRPALWLYLSVTCLSILVLRKKDLRILLTGALIILQAGALFVISFVPNFRYHFSVNLVGLYSLGWLFIGRKRNDDSPASEESSH